jgi:hypothetical protein
MQIKGNILQSRIAFIRDNYGEVGLEKVFEVLPPDEQQILKGVISSLGWFPFEMGDRLDRAIVQILGNGNMRIFEEIGSASAAKNLGSVHQMFLAPGNPQEFLERAPMIYKYYYDIGRREFESTGPNSGVLTTYGAETYSEPDCLTVIGWYKKALEMCGAEGITMYEETCRAKGGPYCRYRVSWTSKKSW